MVIDVVISFCWDEQLEEVGAGVPIAIGISLEKDSTRGVFRGVDGNGERFREVWEMEDGSQQEEFL